MPQSHINAAPAISKLVSPTKSTKNWRISGNSLTVSALPSIDENRESYLSKENELSKNEFKNWGNIGAFKPHKRFVNF
jgi:hypothetical protein